MWLAGGGCGYRVECKGVVIRRWVWLETIGVVSGCFPHITYISLLLLYLLVFAAIIYIPWRYNYINHGIYHKVGRLYK